MFDLVVLLTLLLLGYGFGRYAEKKHYRSIIKREKILRNLPVIASKFPPMYRTPPTTTLVSGSIVISVDYFKRFVATLRNIIGGRVTSYESLLDRARREAILRMKEQAKSQGGSMIFNVKIETSSISKGRKDTIGSIEVLVYGTALKLRSQ
jgi:uncharacterized protein YbjQ (UPF0145 family)